MKNENVKLAASHDTKNSVLRDSTIAKIEQLHPKATASDTCVEQIADEILEDLYNALLAWLPEKRNPKPSEEAMAYEQRDICDICGHDFGWKGYCPCLEYNSALDAVTRVIGELGGKDD